MSVIAPLAEYHGMPWSLYRHIWWDRHPEAGEFFGGSNLTEVQRTMVESALARDDEETAEMYLRDWGHSPRPKPECHVSKFIPGSHFHVLDMKFETYDAAKSHAEQHGYLVLGLREVFVYAREGD